MTSRLPAIQERRGGHWLPFGCLRVCSVTQWSAGDELSVRGRACRQWFGDASESTCIVIADDESKGARAGEQADPPAPCQTISLQLAFRRERKETLYVFAESLHHSHSL